MDVEKMERTVQAYLKMREEQRLATGPSIRWSALTMKPHPFGKHLPFIPEPVKEPGDQYEI